MGGDAITFIMKRDGIEFTEALKQAADLFGISWKGGSTTKGRSESGPLKNANHPVRANEIALEYFRSILNSPAGDQARLYLSSRGITTEVATRQDIGLSPKGMQSLSGHLRSVGVTGTDAKTAGLVTQSQDGNWRDMFSGRLTFAIRNTGGEIIGFAGRSLDDTEPKYLNTARTELFDKSRTLYGLHHALAAIRTSRTAVIVEGYTDTISAHEAGFENVVASMGTAITTEQMALLANNCQTVVLALDPDAAGHEATRNALETLWATYGVSAGEPQQAGLSRRAGIELRVTRLAPGRDPDELIRHSPESWQTAINDSQPLLEWLIEAYATQIDLSNTQGKATITQTVFPMITLISNPYEQDRYLTLLARHVDVSVERLRATASQIRPTKKYYPGRIAKPRSNAESLELFNATEASIEEHLLTLLLKYPDLMNYADGLQDEVFRGSCNRILFTALKRSDTISGLRGFVDQDTQQLVDRLEVKSLPPSDQSVRVADVQETVSRLREFYLRSLKAQEEQVRRELDSGSMVNETKTREQIDQETLDTNGELKKIFARKS